MEIDQEMSSSRVLIFIPVGDNCEALNWIREIPKSDKFVYKIFLAYYGKEPNFQLNFHDPRITVIYDSAPSKFEKFRKYVETKLILVENFDLFWIADDDIRISQHDLSKFFNLFVKYELDLAQPGCLGFAMGKQIVRRDLNKILRYSNYVDGMAPLFSKSALAKCLNTFENSQSGRGIDHVWAALLENPKNKIAIIDSSLMIHMKPSGKFYSRFSSTADRQIEDAKNKYLDLVEHFYGWEEKIIFSSISSKRTKIFNSYFPLYNRFVEVLNLGVSTLVRHKIYMISKNS